MPQIEAIKAERPVIGGPWLDNLAENCWEHHGEHFDFYHEAVDDRKVTLLGTGELAGIHRKTHALGGLPVGSMIRQAEQEVPKSFGHVLPLVPGKLSIGEYDEPSGVVRVLTVDFNSLPVFKEIGGFRGVVDQEAGYELPWREPRQRMKLAVVSRAFNGDVSELASHMPEKITAEAGKVEPVTIELFDRP